MINKDNPKNNNTNGFEEDNSKESKDNDNDLISYTDGEL